MDLDPEGIFRDDSDEDDDNVQEREANKEMVVYLVDASPKMFTPATNQADEKDETHFHTIVNCITQSLKTQIIGRSYDEVAICFFNTKEKKNLQDLAGVYVYNVGDRDPLDRPTAKLIKDFSCIEDSFMSNIGSRYGITAGSRENTLYNALWVVQALLRKGSVKTVSKRILIFTNEDDPFGAITGAVKTDMIRTTLQRAKDAQDLGLSIELLPLSRPDEEFNMSRFYADLIGLDGDEITEYLPSAGEKLEDMTDQLRKQMMKKRRVKTLSFAITNDVCIEVNTYALTRPTTPGTITWLDSLSNIPLKTEMSFICNDTGALLQDPQMRFQMYNDMVVKFSVRELSEVKRVSSHHLRLLGFKPLDCLKDYHNLRPSTFIYPSDEHIFGSTRVFVALHSSMLRLGRFALAFYGNPTRPQLVALVAQEEVTSSAGQVEPPGMHMIYLPYSDDIRYPEEVHVTSDDAPRATDEQIKKASNLLKRIDLKNFSVCQFANPALQRHYGILEALALGEDEMPDIKDETLPDEEGLARPGVVKVIDEFKASVYGENYDQEEAEAAAAKGSRGDASNKRKAITDAALLKSAAYDWAELADNGKLKDMTVMELKSYLTAHGLPLSGKKEALISRILTHLGK
ncbi:ATP-dependent DNA helicase 2 subunit KU70 [Panicum miliaceum]|uniref:ATP-dependent DNA helicase 2 subunit KU70 n=1 Tax=Panicum miliaceum TaxID=4540 RepID=A0A3L6T8Y1_PANMI|nr:ATP-dependent DNA helicase 2 subunit KU70 [Panicum miliaceum]